MRPALLLCALGGAAALVAMGARDSRACGGCFHEVTTQNGTVVTDHRMVFSVSPTQTTLYDQIKYAGSPSSFAWVLPVHGQVTVGLSSDGLFQALDQATQTTILAPPLPVCPACNCRNASVSFGAGAGASSGSGGPDHAGVTVTSQQVVGPYATVQLHPNSTSDTAALTSWLTVNGYNIPSNIGSVIAAYVKEGFDFLALRLVPGQGVQAMRPVSVSSPGAGLALPLRMVAAGTGATVGITLWVVASGRYEPQNFKRFLISPADIVWDWSASASNYVTLRAQKEAALGNAAWQIESSLDLLPYTIENVVLQDPAATDYASTPPDGGATGASAPDGGGLPPIEARAQDLLTLFPTGASSVRITRMRADLSQAALANDLVLQASSDQTALSNTYQLSKSINDSAACPCPCGGANPGLGTGSGSGASKQSFGCATSPGEPLGAGFLLTLGLGMSWMRLRRNRTKRSGRSGRGGEEKHPHPS
jgi:hypothetical protein